MMVAKRGQVNQPMPPPGHSVLGKLRLGTLAALCAFSAPFPSPAHGAAEKAIMADRAADMVGVNTHLNFKGTVYDTAFDTIIKPRLLELGVRHIRDNPGHPNDQTVKNRFIDLARSGVRTLMINSPEAGRQHDYVKALNKAAGFTVVEAVEPPNERDTTWEWFDFGSAWPTRMRDYILTMYPRYKNDPATAGITVLGPSFANTRDSAATQAKAFPNAAAYMDAGNLHDYSGLYPEHPTYSGGWGSTIQSAIDRYKALAGSKPQWVTENGYKMSGYVEGHPVVSQRAAAKYLPRQLLTHLQHGVPRYYIYELINEASEDFGILNNDGSPRLQYRSVKNFVAMFKDPGASFATASLDYRLTGDLANIRRSLFQKRNGRFYLALWQGVPSVSGTRDGAVRDVEPPVRKLTLELASKITRAYLYQPSFSMQASGSYSNADPLAIATADLEGIRAPSSAAGG